MENTVVTAKMHWAGHTTYCELEESLKKDETALV